MKNIIHMEKDFRIVESLDGTFSLDDLMGDMFCEKTNPSLDPAILKKEKDAFIELVESNGVFGYTLEKWNPEIGQGWTHVDSCWGFVGSYQKGSKDFEHYIVDELKGQIK